MPKLHVHSFAMSVDGFVAGPNQDLDNPLGVGGEQLHSWVFGDRAPIDDYFFALGDVGIGATVMGRNMFGPIRGDVGRLRLDRLVGSRPAVPPPGLRAHPPRPRSDRDGGRHHVPLRHRRHRVRARAGLRGGRRPGRPSRWRRRPRCASSSRRPGRRAAPRAIAPLLLGDGERLFDGLDIDDRYDARRDRQLPEPSPTSCPPPSTASGLQRRCRHLDRRVLGAAVDLEHLAGDPRRRVGHEVEHRAGDVLGLARPAHRRAGAGTARAARRR